MQKYCYFSKGRWWSYWHAKLKKKIKMPSRKKRHSGTKLDKFQSSKSLPVLSTEPLLRKVAVDQGLRFSTEQYGHEGHDFDALGKEKTKVLTFTNAVI